MQIFLLLLLLLTSCVNKEIISTPETKPKLISKVSSNRSIFFQPHQLSPEIAKKRMELLAKSLEKYHLAWSWRSDVLEFTVSEGLGDGSHGTLENTDGKIILVIEDIPGIVSLFQERFEKKVKERLEKSFQP